jgi:hypothetical protein
MGKFYVLKEMFNGTDSCFKGEVSTPRTFPYLCIQTQLFDIFHTLDKGLVMRILNLLLCLYF